MARQIKNVALAGPNGNVGSNILKSLIEANVFNITVLLREQASAFPDGITAKVVDFTSVDSLAEAVKGQDAVIDATVGPNPRVSLNLIEASLASQVYRFVPSEFTSDPNDAKTRALPLFQGKRTVHEYIQKLGREGKITFTILSTGAFLDWNLNNGFMFIDLANKEINLMNDGEIVIPWTLLPVAGKATVSALLRPDETVNKTCYVYNIQKSQKELAELAKEALGDDGWQTQRVNMEKVLEEALQQWSNGDRSMKVIGDFIRYSNSTPGFSGRFEKCDNDVLGVETMSDEQIKDLIKEITQRLKEKE